MATRVYVPRETAAVSVGADEVAVAIARQAKEQGVAIELVRNGSWGASWLEPLVEVAVDDKRIAYGNVGADDVPGMFAAGFLDGGQHERRLGPVDEIPYLINQERWTFWRCGLVAPLNLDDFVAHQGFKAFQKAVEVGPQAETLAHRRIAAAGEARGEVPRRPHEGAAGLGRREAQGVTDLAGGDLLVAHQAGEDRQPGGVGRGPVGGAQRMRPSVAGSDRVGQAEFVAGQGAVEGASRRRVSYSSSTSTGLDGGGWLGSWEACSPRCSQPVGQAQTAPPRPT